MSMRRHGAGVVRAFVAVAAAYAVALQALFFAIGGPFGGGVQFAATPICSSHSSFGAGRSTPAGQGGCCLGACLGCCSVTPLCPGPGPALTYAPAPLQTIAAAHERAPAVLAGVAAAHRSRAPPLPA
jgi:hypothetical protein